MTAPSPDLQEALRQAEWGRRYPDPSNRERDFLTLADEIYRLRAELADETKNRLVLAATLESDWAEQCNAMGDVVRDVQAFLVALGNYPGLLDRMARVIPPSVRGTFEALKNSARDFRASGWADDVLTENAR